MSRSSASDPQFPFPNLRLLKLGGSLITDKSRPHTPRLETITRLALEIAQVWNGNLSQSLLIGHGSGSFGHFPARKYGTRQGVHTLEEWQGFVEVWREASALNRLVVDALTEAGLPAVAFAPVACVTSSDGKVEAWDLSPIKAALKASLLPVVYGDVVFDRVRGGTILSTEDLFTHLAHELRPCVLLLAGLEQGVWADYPVCSQLVKEITSLNSPDLISAIGGSNAIDVTGGMMTKVQLSLRLAEEIPGLNIRIFSAETSGMLQSALLGEPVGTLLRK